MDFYGAHMDAEHVCFLGPGLSKRQALDALVDALAQDEAVTDRERLRAAVREREQRQSTMMARGVAFPHGASDTVREPALVVGVSREGLDIETFDGQPVHIMVLFAMPPDRHADYLRLLGKTSALFRMPKACQALCACPDETTAAGLCAALSRCATPRDVLAVCNRIVRGAPGAAAAVVAETLSEVES